MRASILLMVVWTAFALAKTNSYEPDHSNLLNDSTRIVNGFNSTRGQFPHQALLFILHPQERWMRCGGSILSERWILTAAHCTVGAILFEVHLGANVFRNFKEEGRVVRNTTTRIQHPNYIPILLLNDIALLRLDEPVKFTEFIQPIRLAEPGNDYHNIPAIASGFGDLSSPNGKAPFILQWAHFTTVSNWECARLFRNRASIAALPPSVICAVGVRQASGCYGDSGGPLTTEEGVLIGVTSFVSNHGCVSGYPTAFARVGYFLNWIFQVTGISY